YADRPQVVTGNTSNELHPAALAQWAEPLADNFARVLAENLSLLLDTDRVAVFPWRGPLPMEYQVMVEVTRFLGEPGGEVSLVALWSVVGKNGKEVVVSKKSSFSEPTRGQDYEALAAAMSRTVAALSRDIATAIAADSQKVSSRQ
ncbi:MAG TPA: PqiC family protein, partial [Candidatus Binatia bacterium]|nr:PqiC family protein [Candidatus Binatia bacterium]